jgi:hypothetical protein
MMLASSKTHGIAVGVAANKPRLSPCPCGSNLWYKKCHGVILGASQNLPEKAL